MKLLYSLFCLFCFIGISFSQAQKVDSLLVVLNSKLPDEEHLMAMQQLSRAYLAVDVNQMVKHSRKYIRLAEKLEIDSLVADGYMDIATANVQTSKIDSALYYFTKGFEKSKEISYTTGIGRSLIGIGYSYDLMDLDAEAINKYMEAIEIYKKLNHLKGLNQCYINIGSLYFDMGNYKSAKIYFKKAYDSFKKAKDESGIGYAAFTMGNVSKRLKDFDKAKEYFKESLAIRQKLQDGNGLALVYWGLGSIEVERGNFGAGIEDLKLSLKFNEQFKNDYQIANVDLSLAQAYAGLKQYEEAYFYAKRALETGKRVNSKVMQASIYKTLIEIAEAKNDRSQAYQYQSDYITVTDSLDYEKTLSEINLAEFRRVNSENEGLIKNKESIESKNAEYLYTIIIISGLLAIVIVLLILFYKRNLERKATNAILEEQKEEITSINEELTQQMEITSNQNLELEKLNAIKNKFFSIVSHDLRSPMATLKMLFELYRRGELNNDDLSDLIKQLEETIFTTADFLDNLLEWSKSQLDGITISPENFEIAALVEENLTIMGNSIHQKEIQINQSIASDVKVFADRNMINVVIRNLLSNAVKFCQNCDHISIFAEVNSKTVKIGIQDTGIGIDKKDLEQLFTLEHVVTTGTSGEKGHHIGLVLCKDMIEQNHGSINVESQHGEGSLFSIELPAGK